MRPGQTPLPPTFTVQPEGVEFPTLAAPTMDTDRRTPYRRAESARRASSSSAMPEIEIPWSRHMSYLELASVGPSTLTDYQRRAEEFLRWCQLHQSDWSTPEELDALLVLWMDEAFFKGLPCSHGSKMIAALKFFAPLALKMNLPRSSRALKSWEKHAPPLQRLPFPWLALCAVIGVLCHRSLLWTAACLYFQFRTYLRPGECDRLRVRHLIPPVPHPDPRYAWWGLLLHPLEEVIAGKTGLFDESILLDHDPWIGELMMAITVGRDVNDHLWPLPPHLIVSQFMSACDFLHLQALRPCRYGISF